jgi:ParB-like partition proteins
MAKSSKKQVGKGIKALLANIEKSEKTGIPIRRDNNNQPGVIRELNIDAIEVNPFQPRTEFNPEDLEDLIQSIKIHGIIQPIAVRKLNANKYQIISGERRWRAAKNNKLKTIPVHIIEADDQEMLEIALLENLQRADLNPMEIAISFQRLIDDCSLTHEQLSERIGKKRSSISNYLRLLKLSPSVQEAIKGQLISMGHAKVLAGLEHIEQQTAILGLIIRDDLSIRATETLIKSKMTASPSHKRETRKDPMIAKITEDLYAHFGSKVTIKRSKSGAGVIKISFQSDDEFNDVIDTILS